MTTYSQNVTSQIQLKSGVNEMKVNDSEKNMRWNTKLFGDINQKKALKVNIDFGRKEQWKDWVFSITFQEKERLKDQTGKFDLDEEVTSEHCDADQIWWVK